VLIYWTVEKGGAMAVHSQLLECSASEVHAMVEGAMRHGTDMEVEASYVDTHGQSFIGFGVTRLLGFDLLPRIKQINRCRLYLSGRARSGPLPAAAARADQPDPLGIDRKQLRPHGEIRHSHPARNRLD
jgi:TnpA family transposase